MLLESYRQNALFIVLGLPSSERVSVAAASTALASTGPGRDVVAWIWSRIAALTLATSTVTGFGG